ncbi:MAG: hypoxanthine phosphoribosyltransferase [Kiritimatiellaeota bacterium]|nr:hypoxanthine phosphoribosyltransferase [Kiritimatiellota bacterium]
MEKFYLGSEKLLLDSFKLARMVWDSGWRPDVMLALWRGGTPVGVAVHEFFQYAGWRVRHMAVKTASYTGIGARQEARLEFAREALGAIADTDNVLVVDDVLDSGGTMRAVLDSLNAGNRAGGARSAVLYWKPSAGQYGVTPDYHVGILEKWIVFPHELEGLTRGEVAVKSPEIAGLLP